MEKEPFRVKSVGVAVLLATLPGFIGLLGIGHFYVRRFRRACLLLVGGWLLLGLAFVLLAFWSMSGMVIPPPGYPRVEVPASAVNFLLASLLLGIGFVVLWVLQIFDARAICRRYADVQSLEKRD